MNLSVHNLVRLLLGLLIMMNTAQSRDLSTLTVGSRIRVIWWGRIFHSGRDVLHFRVNGKLALVLTNVDSNVSNSPSESVHPNWIWSAHLYNGAADWVAGCRPRRRQLPTHDRFSAPPGVLVNKF